MTANLINQLMTPLIFLLFAVGFFVVWFTNKRLESSRWFGVSYLFGSLAFLFEMLLSVNQHPAFLVFTADSLYFFTVAFFVVAIARKYDAVIPYRMIAGLFALSMMLNAWFWFVHPSMQVRSHLVSIACGVFFLVALPIIWKSRKNLLDKILFWLVSVAALQFIVNTSLIVFILGEMITTENFAYSTFLAVVNLSTAAVSLSIAISLFVSYGMEMIRELRHRSDTDALSGLLNRRGVEERFERLIDRGNATPMTMIVLDIDHFKKVNDSHGHTTGDEVIRRLSSIIRGAARSGDVSARIGGEEFCLLMPIATAEMAKLVAESIRLQFEAEQFSSPTFNFSDSFDVTVSLGIAQYKHGQSYIELYRDADQALYAAKSEGRNRVIVWQGQRKREPNADQKAEQTKKENIKSG